MIRGFRHKGLKRFYEAAEANLIPPALLSRVEKILAVLDASSSPAHLALPGYRLHPLKGPLKGFWSVTVSANWRIVFRIENGDAFDVDLVDYH